MVVPSQSKAHSLMTAATASHEALASTSERLRQFREAGKTLVIVSHEAKEAAMQRALGAIDALDAVPDGVKLIRMEEL